MTVRVRDVDVHFDEIGEGRPLVLLHGWEGVGRVNVASVEPHFIDRPGWRRIYPDLPGHGKTPLSPSLCSHEDVLDFLLEFIEAIVPGERFCLAGWSWGGDLAMGILHHWPDRISGIFLGAPYIAKETQRPAHQVIRRDEEFRSALRPEEEWLQNEVVSQSMALLASARLYMSLLTPQDPAIGTVISVPFSFDSTVLAKPCLAPALVVTGRQDHEVGYEAAWRLRANFPRGTFAVLDGAGHFLDAEKPKVLTALFADWLDRVEDELAGLASPAPPA
jgi:pimeloyl-ACP methyl ester carboxylesterase